MSALAVFLIAVGVADILRSATARVWPAAAAGPVVTVLCGGLAGLWHVGDITALLLVAAATTSWTLWCRRAEASGTGQIPPLLLFGGSVGVLLAISGLPSPAAGPVASWLRWVGAGDTDPTRALMIAGVLLLQLVTGNQLVRLVLSAVGAVRPANQPQPSDQLKGGRLLGPMERILIVGLGLGGQLAAASIVVAAKSIIRFPELNAQRKSGTGSTIDEVTEYFLVGSFASWLLAMAGLALTVPV